VSVNILIQIINRIGVLAVHRRRPTPAEDAYARTARVHDKAQRDPPPHLAFSRTARSASHQPGCTPAPSFHRAAPLAARSPSLLISLPCCAPLSAAAGARSSRRQPTSS